MRDGEMDAKAALEEARREFGEPARDGVGRIHPGVGHCRGSFDGSPVARADLRFGDGETVWLISTDNRAEENVLGEFEMDTLPDPANHGDRVGMGEVHITKDRLYHFGGNEFDYVQNSLVINWRIFFFCASGPPRGNHLGRAGDCRTAGLKHCGRRRIARLRFSR